MNITKDNINVFLNDLQTSKKKKKKQSGKDKHLHLRLE